MDTLNSFARTSILKDWKIWICSLMYLSIGTTGYAVTFFMPTILLEFGWLATEAQIRTIPVYAVSAVVMLTVAYLSDKYCHRYGFVMLGCVIATIGYAILLSQGGLSRDTKFAAIFLVAIGGYISTPMGLAWLSNNVSGHWKRAISSGAQVMLGNISGIVGTNIFLASEAPKYHTGYGVALALIWVGAICATFFFLGLLRENKKREAGLRDYRLNLPEEEVKNMGDDHPTFRFTL
jgi:sugar phosphate permease